MEKKETENTLVFIVVLIDYYVLHIILDNVFEVHVHVLLVVPHRL
jgi:hypothetical protein